MNSRRPPSGDLSQRIENLLEAPVFASENIALSNPPLLFREQLYPGYVVDSDDVESGIDICRHSSIDEVENHLSCGRGLYVPRSYRRGRVYNYDWKPRSCEFKRSLLGDELRSFVMPDHVIECDRTILVCRLAILPHPYGADGAGVDNPFHSGLTTSGEQVSCAVGVAVIDLLRISCPEAVIGCDVIDPTATLHASQKRLRILQVADHDVAWQTFDVCLTAGITNQYSYPVAA